MFLTLYLSFLCWQTLALSKSPQLLWKMSVGVLYVLMKIALHVLLPFHLPHCVCHFPPPQVCCCGWVCILLSPGSELGKPLWHWVCFSVASHPILCTDVAVSWICKKNSLVTRRSFSSRGQSLWREGLTWARHSSDVLLHVVWPSEAWRSLEAL